VWHFLPDCLGDDLRHYRAGLPSESAERARRGRESDAYAYADAAGPEILQGVFRDAGASMGAATSEAMSANSKIEWTTHTFNPWIGCTKVSPGCAHCYAETLNKRWKGGENWGKGAPRKRTTEAYWRQPLKWDREAGKLPPFEAGIEREWHRPRVFPSLCDWLDDEVPIEWLADFLNLIRITQYLDWQLLTKRPELFSRRIQAVIDHNRKTLSRHDSEMIVFCDDWLTEGGAPPNVWLGVSVEDQQRAEDRIPMLLGTPAAIHFLSCEPLLGPLDLRKVNATPSITISALKSDTFVRENVDWVIVGGESGRGARPCNVRWIRDLVSQCKTTGCPVFVKQLGYLAYECVGPSVNPERPLLLKDRKGGDTAEWPEDLRIRQMPHISGEKATCGP
jgi:protein gp37